MDRAEDELSRHLVLATGSVLPASVSLLWNRVMAAYGEEQRKGKECSEQKCLCKCWSQHDFSRAVRGTAATPGLFLPLLPPQPPPAHSRVKKSSWVPSCTRRDLSKCIGEARWFQKLQEGYPGSSPNNLPQEWMTQQLMSLGQSYLHTFLPHL